MEQKKEGSEREKRNTCDLGYMCIVRKAHQRISHNDSGFPSRPSASLLMFGFLVPSSQNIFLHLAIPFFPSSPSSTHPNPNTETNKVKIWGKRGAHDGSGSQQISASLARSGYAFDGISAGRQHMMMRQPVHCKFPSRVSWGVAWRLSFFACILHTAPRRRTLTTLAMCLLCRTT